jgi:hypothetical protein
VVLEASTTNGAVLAAADVVAPAGLVDGGVLVPEPHELAATTKTTVTTSQLRTRGR